MNRSPSVSLHFCLELDLSLGLDEFSMGTVRLVNATLTVPRTPIADLVSTALDALQLYCRDIVDVIHSCLTWWYRIWLQSDPSDRLQHL